MTCSVEDLSKLFEAALDAWGDWLKRQDEWPRVEAVLKGFADLEDVRLPAFWIRNLEVGPFKIAHSKSNCSELEVCLLNGAILFQ